MSKLLFLLGCGSTEPAANPPPVSEVLADDSSCEGPLQCRASCDGGDALACNRLGLLVHDGRSGAPRDAREAAARYRQACELGAGIGCYNLSHMLRTGDGMPENVAEADTMLARTHTLYERSCAAGGLTWCTNLAGLVQRGEGRDPDQEHARNLYRDTCERGDDLACLELAYMLQDGHGGAPDPAAAYALLDKTCQGGSGPACNNLGLMIETVGEDPIPLFRKACDLEVAMACRNLALRSPAETRLPLLRKACDAPVGLDGMACAIAAQMLVNAEPPDTRMAGTYLVRACSVGVAEACVPAVQLAAEGHIVLLPGEAVGLVDRGCKLGDPVACQVLQGAPAEP